MNMPVTSSYLAMPKTKRNCSHYVELYEGDRHHINWPEYNNCVLCRAEAGPVTSEKIGELLGLTKQRIGQLEKKALSAFLQKMHFRAKDWKYD